MTTAPTLTLGSACSLPETEQQTIQHLWEAILRCEHPAKDALLEVLPGNIHRVKLLADALEAYPPIFEERVLGARKRDLDTLVDLLGKANDANFEMFLPTRALAGRTLVMAELNLWRLFTYVCDEICTEAPGEPTPVKDQVDDWLHGCVFTLLAEDVLGTIAMDEMEDREIRKGAVTKLVHIWENYLTWAVRDFFPLLQATWEARRRIRVSVGTLLGASEIMRLMQAGCDPEFVGFFAHQELSEDERMAFHEFLIGVTTEQIHSLEQFMEISGKASLSPEEAQQALGQELSHPEDSHLGVGAYQFFRERFLQAASRRLRKLPGPKKTAEEYVVLYFLRQEISAKQNNHG